jgi:hypothetical protein
MNPTTFSLLYLLLLVVVIGASVGLTILRFRHDAYFEIKPPEGKEDEKFFYLLLLLFGVGGWMLFDLLGSSLTVPIEQLGWSRRLFKVCSAVIFLSVAFVWFDVIYKLLLALIILGVAFIILAYIFTGSPDFTKQIFELLLKALKP